MDELSNTLDELIQMYDAYLGEILSKSLLEDDNLKRTRGGGGGDSNSTTSNTNNNSTEVEPRSLARQLAQLLGIFIQFCTW